MNGKYFLDTNIFVYSFNNQNKSKQKKAQKLISQALMERLGIVSFQVVQEFINVMTKKIAVPLSTKDCLAYIDEIFEPLCEVYPDMETYKKAIHIQEETGYSFYDALIVSAASKAGCKIIYSEDLMGIRETV